MADFETVVLLFDLAEDLEVRRHPHTKDSVALASFTIHGRSPDDLLDLNMEEFGPVVEREMHRCVSNAHACILVCLECVFDPCLRCHCLLDAWM